MSTAIRKRQRWTEADWRSFVTRLCGVWDIFHDFACRFPATRGLAVKRHIDPWNAARNHVEVVMVTLEDHLVAHFGGESAVPGGAIGFARGRFLSHGGPDNRDERPCAARGRHNPPTILSREEWERWGDKSKRAQRELVSLSVEIANALGNTKTRRTQVRLSQAERRLLTARSHMENLMLAQHPDWKQPDCLNVFFGRLPEEAP